MPISFNSGVLGAPYNRVMSFTVDYTEFQAADVVIYTRSHVLLADGTHAPLGDTEMLSFSITLRT